jgi:predicted dehydrogenase
MKIYNWGIISPGKIAHKFAEGMKVISNANLYAVASSSQERADAFAQQYSVEKAYNSYLDLVQDSNVDVIYIASTNNFHFEHAKLCLEHGKACLCEKPFTLNSAQLQELIQIARKNNVFLMEALWTMFLPSISVVGKLIANKSIGEITSMKIDFGFQVPYNEDSRLFSPELGGGALLDIGLYPLFLALHLLGEPKSLQASAVRTNKGVDISDSIVLQYDSNVKVLLEATFAEDLPCEAKIVGTTGTIIMHRMWHCPTKITLENEKGIEDCTPEYIGNGYNYEIVEVQKCIENNRLESDKMSLQFSSILMSYLDKIGEISQ